jgi:murein DD-endopeptidase MepM/ murein hydrolase activator NlpD
MCIFLRLLILNSSLYVSALEIDTPEATILAFAEIFGWTVDFATQVQTGDSFEILYEKRYRDGADAGVGRVLAGSFTNVGEKFDGYLFENEEGNPAYYSSEGEAMIKQFLKAPLAYNRITSGFTYSRFHPTQGTNMPHRAIDYAAPRGTPIRAVGDGTIRRAGWNGGYGIAIDIHHNDIYDTRYAHLSSLAKGIRSGVRVTQGQVIGYVGTTGWSTGNHLHYEIHKFGTPVNPLQIDLPPGDPVAEDKREEFEIEKRKYDTLILQL